jgi:hypothetical protein
MTVTTPDTISLHEPLHGRAPQHRYSTADFDIADPSDLAPWAYAEAQRYGGVLKSPDTAVPFRAA